MLDVLRRLFVSVEPRTPQRGVEAVDNLSDIAATFERDTERQAVNWQRGGAAPLVGRGHRFTVADHLKQGG